MEDNPCCQSMIQTFLIIFNCIAFLASGGVLAFSAYALWDGGFNKSLLPEGLPDSLAGVIFDTDGKSFQLPVIILATVSALVVLVSFLGCVGSCKQSRCLVALYFVCLFSFLLVLMGATAYCFMGDPRTPIVASMLASMSRYRSDNLTAALWDSMQGELNCCGAESIDDWKTMGLNENCSAPWSCRIENIISTVDKQALVSDLKDGIDAISDGVTVSDSTTNLTISPSTANPTASDSTTTRRDRACLTDLSTPHYNEGCLSKLKDVMQKYINIIGIIMVSVWFIVMINVLFSFALCIVLDYAEYTYK